jgi:hypothetical protein
MPINNPAPDFALLSGFNARTWSSVNVFDRGSDSISLPSYDSSSGVYDDVLSFLNGRGSAPAQSLDTLLTTSATFGASWSIEITDADRVKISSDTEFSIIATNDDPLGFNSVLNTATGSGSLWSITAPAEWIRGDFEYVSYLISEIGGAGAFNFNVCLQGAQDVITTFRSRGNVSDADDLNVTDNLEALDHTATSSGLIRWLIDSDGHVCCYYPATESAITWVDVSFRNRLGFSGSEVPAVFHGSSTDLKLRADYVCPGVLYPSRPMQSHSLAVSNRSQAHQKIDGSFTSNLVGSYIRSVLRLNLDAFLDIKDEYRHFTNHFAQYIAQGHQVNYYQNWGDPRRAIISSAVNASVSAYDLLNISADNGKQGRIRASAINTGEISLAYPTAFERRVPVRLELAHL